MKFILLLILSVTIWRGSAQVTKYSNEVYTSYFSPFYHEPLYVVYELEKGGGPCDRKKFHFVNGDCDGCATDGDYDGQDYEKGHLCNAQDEAYNCEREKLTFIYYNCVPQTRMLNRGVWRSWEKYIRDDSQTEKLLIICGSIFGSKYIGDAAVPDYCWKIVYDSLGNLKYCLIFPNDDSGEVCSIGLSELKKKLGYKLSYELN